MNKPKNIQIPMSLFLDMYILTEDFKNYNFSENEDMEKRIQRIETQIKEKVEAMEKRDAFTKYKTAKQDTLEREEARKKYLKKAEMKKDYVSNKEVFTSL